MPASPTPTLAQVQRLRERLTPEQKAEANNAAMMLRWNRCRMALALSPQVPAAESR